MFPRDTTTLALAWKNLSVTHPSKLQVFTKSQHYEPSFNTLSELNFENALTWALLLHLIDYLAWRLVGKLQQKAVSCTCTPNQFQHDEFPTTTKELLDI